MGKKKVSTIVLERKEKGRVHEAYQILEETVKKWHPHLKEAKIAIAWNLAWKADPDGRLVLGKCKKVGELDRQFHDFDFVILLNKEVWDKSLEEFGNNLKHALIDHELCHAQISLDGDGNPKKDEQGRFVWRIKKHDLEEFREIVNRHGLWKSDITAFVKTAIEKCKTPLLNEKTGS